MPTTYNKLGGFSGEDYHFMEMTAKFKGLELRIDKKNVWTFHRRKYYMVMKMNEVLVNFTTWRTFRNIRLSKRSQIQKSICYKIFLHATPNRQNYLMM